MTKESERVELHKRVWFWVCVLIVFAVVGTIAEIAENGSDLSESTTDSEDQPTEAELVVRRNRATLDRLDKRCEQSPIQLARMAIRGVEIVEEDGGPRMSPSEFLARVDTATTGVAVLSQNRSCADVFGVFMTLLVNQE